MECHTRKLGDVIASKTLQIYCNVGFWILKFPILTPFIGPCLIKGGPFHHVAKTILSLYVLNQGDAFFGSFWNLPRIQSRVLEKKMRKIFGNF
jgi:hypothetical protein